MPVRAITEADIDTPRNIGPEVSGILPGTEKRKSPYTESQTKDAGFATRMGLSLKRIESIEQSGFDPANFGDLLVEYLGGDEGEGPRAWAERLMLSPKYKQYLRAKMDFSTAQLRKETGATINNVEIVWVDKTYFPLIFDDPVSLQDKFDARRTATAGMRVGAGEAFNDVKKAIEDYVSELGVDTPEAALVELRRRAQEDPELTEKLRAMGLL